jgi:hypothetical protein
MRHVLFLSLLFLSSSLWADCRVSTGTDYTTIPESKSVSLFEKGKSLETHRVQDQDGLGVCYANASSSVLKSILPGNPDLSYTQIALANSTAGWSADTKWAGAGSKYVSTQDGKTKDFTADGGYMCQAIAAMKKMGGACPQSKSLLEKKELMDPDIQERIFLSLGKYFDKVNELKKDPAKFESFKKDLALAIETLNVENAKFTQQCEDSKKTLPVDVGLEVMAMANLDGILKDNSDCAQKKLAKLKSVMAPDAKVTSDQVYVKFSESFVNKLRGRFSQNEALSKNIYEFFKKQNETKEERQKLGALVEKEVNAFLNEELSSDDQSCQMSLNGKSFLVGDRKSMGEDFLSDMKYDHQRDCSQEMKTLKVFEYDTLINKNQCSDPSSLSVITDAIEPLLDVGYKLDDALKEALSNPVSKYASQMSNILYPECADKAKMISMDDVSCASFTTCDTSMYKNLSNDVYSGPANGCYSMDTAKSMIRTKTFNAITGDRALGISVCTSFLEDPTVKTDFCRKAGEGVEGHSYHAMTVSGYRCVDGKIEYEILNSWGSSYCPVNDGKMKNDAFDCVSDKYGNPTGRFWVKEDVLVDSTTDINAVTVRKK